MKPSPDAEKLSLARLQWTALAIGVAAGAVSVVAVLLHEGGSLQTYATRRQWMQSYLFAFVYFWVIATGCLGLALIYQMTGGRWGYASRPFFDAAIRTLPLLCVLFVPLALGLRDIYAWTEPGYFAGVPHAENRAWYLTPQFFLLRSAGYLVACTFIGLVFTTGVVKPDGRMSTRQWPRLAALSTVALALAFSFAAIDWVMTLQTFYYSTLWGALLAIGALLAGMCVAAAGVGLALHRLGRRDELSLDVLHGIGKLLLAMLMLWAYLSFSQFLITYSGNLPDEAAWYMLRLEHGWQWLALSLVVLHFAVPFALLLSRAVKRDPLKLAALALGLAAMHAVDLFWLIAPAFHPEGLRLHWLDVVVPLAIGGLWCAEFFRQLGGRLLPVLEHWPLAENHHA